MAVNNGQNIFNDKQDFEEQYRDKFIKILGKYYGECTDQERYNVLAHLIAEKAREIQSTSYIHADKQVYYFSLEFLLGPLLENYLLNLGITDVVAEGLKEMGTSLQELAAQEVDPGLGNGGLGRLAACFLDSMAHEGMAGFGNGMRYRYGLFRQEIKDGRQVERTDNWLANGYPWEVRKDDSSVLVRFGGTVVRHEDENGNFWFSQEGGQVVRAVPYDVPIVGYGAKTVNKLRLWSAEPAEEDFDLDAFNAGDYARANKFRSDVEAISTILYPNDSGEHGRILRLKQEYLFVSAGLQTILRAYKDKYGEDWEHFADHVCIHTNDTHPAMCGPELMRLLVDDHGVDFNEAFDIARNAISYTNHTVMPEALEKWPINTFRELLPRLYMFIDEVDRLYKEQLLADSNGNTDLLASTAVLWDNTVRMANLSILFSHSVNGVSDLHTNILKQSVLKDFYKLRPEIFNNKTNGICHRRFLAQANTAYAKLISEAIGTGWLDDANELQKLSAFENNAEFLDKMDAAKKEEKERLAAYVKKTTGVEMDTNTIFDTQVKRFHAYKRQLLNVFKILYLYNRMLDDPSYKPAPTTFIFSGKAAQSYTFAKEVIRLIHSVADVVNNDERIEGRLKIVFIPNFAVSNAQLIYAASDISEQISVAGAEASGTSNMKLMMNAALTLGTYDGSNIEISELAGPENIKIFGLRADEVQEVYASGTYFAQNLLNQNPTLARIVNMLTDGSLSRLSGNFESIHDYLLINNDPDLVLIDFDAYVKAWEELTQSYADRRSWNARALHNTANSGFFSADRTIREYMEDIWHV